MEAMHGLQTAITAGEIKRVTAVLNDLKKPQMRLREDVAE